MLEFFELFFAILGVLTCVFVILNMFTAHTEDKRPPYMRQSISFDDMDQFLTTIAYAVNSTVDQGTSIRTLTNGAEFLPDVLEEIQGAKSYIYITNYLWDDGTFGNSLFKALIKKAEEGVCVCILLDAIGGRKTNKKLQEKLMNAGGSVEYFRPLRWWNITRWHRRSHMRDIVIDGKVGYVGGIAFTDEWLGDATKPTSWHDFMFKTDGALVERLEQVFCNLWSLRTGEILPVNTKREHSKPTSRFVMLYSSPSPDTSSDMEHFMWISIIAAKKSIYITNPYILPSRSIREALIAKARSGVDVKILGPLDTDAKQVKLAGELYYPKLIKGGVRIYEYLPSRIHAKTMVIDGAWSIIGSANMDNRSSRINLELVVGSDDATLAETLTQKFNEDIEKSVEIKDYNHRLGHKLLLPLRYLSRLFIRQY